MSNGDANTLYAFGYNLELTISSLRQKKKKIIKTLNCNIRL